ncbi:MAG: serine hydrolase, partial [Gemmatimonadota bacterium]
LTAAAMGLLVQRGRLDLDLPVQRYVPSFPEKRWPITSRMVAGHLAGIRHYDGEEFLSTRRYATVAEGLEIFAEDSLLFEPGEQFRYSSYGWNLLSAVVEGASDEEFLSFMDREVFEPLGMMSTVADHADSIVPYRTRFYQVADDGRIYNSPFVDNSYKWAGGGFLSTPSDLVRFGMAHLDGSLLRPEIIEMMWTSQKTAAGEETENGVGWFLDRAFDGGRVVSHGGGSIGGVTYLLLLPDSGVVVALTANVSQGVGLQRAAHLLAEAFLNPPSVTTRPDVAVAASWAGGWRCEAFMEGQLRAKADFAFVERAGRIAGFGGWEIQLEDEENVPTDVTVGWSDPESHSLSFVTVDDRGNPTRIILERAASPSRVTGTWFDGNLGTLSCTR